MGGVFGGNSNSDGDGRRPCRRELSACKRECAGLRQAVEALRTEEEADAFVAFIRGSLEHLLMWRSPLVTLFVAVLWQLIASFATVAPSSARSFFQSWLGQMKSTLHV